jgi:radical SAM protein with 4Fe4S-binding SPASM domain
MPGRYAKLKKDWLLRGWIDKPKTVSNRVSGDVRQLEKKEFYVAESCNGDTDFNSLAFLPEHRALLDALIIEGIAAECHAGDLIDHYQWYRKANTPCVIEIIWNVTGMCNLNCRHCYMESPSGRYGELQLKDMAQLIEQFEHANVLQISLTGGEPFLRKDILEVIELLAEKKIWIKYIYSNGLLITEDHLKCIKGLGFFPSFQISFDGVGSHDQMRGTKGIESDVIEGIKRVRAAGFPVSVSTCIDRMNIGRLSVTYDLIKELGIQTWRIGRPYKSGYWKRATTALSIDEVVKVYTAMLDHWLEDAKPFSIELAGFYKGAKALKEETLTNAPTTQDFVIERSRLFTALYGFKGKYFEEISEYTPESYICGHCRERPNLLPDGTLVPCPGYVDSDLQNKMPNLLQEDLSTAWTKSFLREIADMRKRDLLAKNPECAECELFSQCGVGCRALALSETGDLMAKDPDSCEMWKKGYKKRFQEKARTIT